MYIHIYVVTRINRQTYVISLSDTILLLLQLLILDERQTFFAMSIIYIREWLYPFVEGNCDVSVS